MFKLKPLISSARPMRLFSQLRLISNEVQPETPNALSSRQKEWLEARQRYANYENVLYSSYLEKQEEHMSYGLRRSMINKLRNGSNYANNRQEDAWGKKVTEVPENWMDEYEYYAGSTESNASDNNLGTADPAVPASNIACNGCGAHLHCNHHTRPGFLPAEIFKGRTANELKSIICQRCHFLKHYNVALDLEVTAQSYIDTISRIKNEFALAIVIVDLLDFPCSLWPGMHELLGPKRPVFVVGNKVDLLPRDCNSYLDHAKQCLKQELVKSGFDQLNIKHVSLISAKTGYGVEELITQLHKIWAYKGDVYVVGCTNVGKSSLFNILLNSDYCRPEATDLIRKATTCPWPGTTLQMLKFPIYRPSELRVYQRFRRLNSEKYAKAEMEKLRLQQGRKTGNVEDIMPVGAVGRTLIQTEKEDMADAFSMSSGTQPITTLNERSKDYRKARWVYDTPGVMHPDQITNLLSPSELADIQPKQMISPRAYRLKVGMSLFVAGLARLDFTGCERSEVDWIQVFLFASFNLPTMIVQTESAEEVYRNHLNSPLCQVPRGDAERLRDWPSLQSHPQEFCVKGYILKPKVHEINCSGDITLSSAGWVGLRVPIDVECRFRAWTPLGRGIHFRETSLVPYAERLIGKRIRNSLAYNTARPFIFKK